MLAVSEETASSLAFSVYFGICGKCENKEKLHPVKDFRTKENKKTLHTQPPNTPRHRPDFVGSVFHGGYAVYCVSFLLLHARTVPRQRRHVHRPLRVLPVRAYTFFSLFSDLAFSNVLRMCLCFGGLSFVQVIAYAW